MGINLVNKFNYITRPNIDLIMSKARNNIFGMLGAAFSYKCLLSPVLKVHLFRTYTCPILQSCLSCFSLRTNMLEPLAIFHRKTLKGILNLSKYATTPAIHFLLGELPIEGKLHCDVFSLFFCIWRNPDSKIYSIMKYLLETSDENSRTWAVQIQCPWSMTSLTFWYASGMILPQNQNTRSLFRQKSVCIMRMNSEPKLKITAVCCIWMSPWLVWGGRDILSYQE